MSTTTLHPALSTFDLGTDQGLVTYPLRTLLGGSDEAECLAAIEGSKALQSAEYGGDPGSWGIIVALDFDQNDLPGAITISTVTAKFRIKTNDVVSADAFFEIADRADFTNTVQVIIEASSASTPAISGSYQTYEFEMATNPVTAAPWVAADLDDLVFVISTALGPGDPADENAYEVDYVALDVVYTGGATYSLSSSTETVTDPDTGDETTLTRVIVIEDPEGDPIGDLPALAWYQIPYDGGKYWVYQRQTPGTGWTPGAGPENKYGWWRSEESFAGYADVIQDAVPKRPRGLTELALLQAEDADVASGAAVAVVFHGQMIYAKGNYSVGTDMPQIHVFDGISNRQLVQVPHATVSDQCLAVVTMLVANQQIFFSTLDEGLGGRVFLLDPAAAKLTLIATALTGGEVPYALAFANSRLYVGTNNGDGSGGRLLSIRPDDVSATDWTEVENDTTTGVSSLCVFQGSLYVGTDAVAAGTPKILKLGTDGTLSAAFTGNAAAAYEGILAMTVFEEAIYASYWEGNVSRVLKSTAGVSWTDAYTDGNGTKKPIITLPVVNGLMYAIAGPPGAAMRLLRTDDGASWTDLTDFLPDTAAASPALVGLRF